MLFFFGTLFLFGQFGLQFGQTAVFEFGRPVEVVAFLRFSIWLFRLSSSSRSFCTLPMEAFSFSHLAFSSLNWLRISESSLRISSKCSWDSLSLSFAGPLLRFHAE